MLDQPIENALHRSSVCPVALTPFYWSVHPHFRELFTSGLIMCQSICVYVCIGMQIHIQTVQTFFWHFLCFERYLCTMCIVSRQVAHS